jgi:uncharacterized protein
MTTTATLEQKAAKLLSVIAGCQSAAVAFSGGADSSLLALAARKALGEAAVAVTATSPTLARAELDNARAVAAEIGIRQAEVFSDETSQPDFAANDRQRCCYCKKYRLRDICRWAKENGRAWVLEGSNLDDADDYRPGLRALSEYPEVKSPLKECGLTKADVRALAREWGLSVWDKPASPCLASRVKYGLAVTPERLRMIEAAEAVVAGYCPGRANIRVRCHEELARIEVDRENLPRLADPALSAELAAKLKALGFNYVTLDLSGFKSGSMNAGL